MTDAMPTKLPPLRGDVPTLVVGKLSKPLKTLEYTITGTLGGKEIRVPVSLPVPAADVGNFFLTNVAAQWREHKDRPALLQADRTLAYAHDENEMARGKLIADADWALENQKYDHAYRLYQQALKVDPHSGEAKAGVKLVEDLRSGKVTPEKLRAQYKQEAAGDRMARIAKTGKDQHAQVKFVNRGEALFGQPVDPREPVKQPDVNAPAERRDILQDVQARQAVAAQEANQVVQDVIRRAKVLVRTEPDSAHLLLKRTLDGVLTNPDLSQKAQTELAQRLQANLQLIDQEGSRVKQAQVEGSALAAIADSRRRESLAIQANQSAIKERLKAFDALMTDARYEQAFVMVRDMQADMIEHGQSVPTAVIWRCTIRRSRPSTCRSCIAWRRFVRRSGWMCTWKWSGRSCRSRTSRRSFSRRRHRFAR